MEFLIYLICFIGAIAILKNYNLDALKPIRGKKSWIAIALLTALLAWGGEKPSPDPDEPDPPTPPTPDEPDEPYKPIEGVRVKLIGREIEGGKFVPIHGEWIELEGSNIVEQIQEIIKNEH